MEINLLEPTTMCCFGPFTRRKTKEDLPHDILARMVAKSCILGALAWDYADTVLDIAARMRIGKTKPLSRAVKNCTTNGDGSATVSSTPDISTKRLSLRCYLRT